MPSNISLKILFFGIFAALFSCTLWASVQQPVWLWTGLTSGQNRYWTIATLMDAYCGFLTFYAWVFYKEPRWTRRILWFIAIMLLGNMAMSGYVLWQLFKVRTGDDPAGLLTARNL